MPRTLPRYLVGLTALFLLMGFSVPGAPPLLLRNPTLSRTQIAFSYGGDLWTVARAGGVATRLTVGAGIESHPIFSPDGTQIAFTGEYDGNTDVFVMPSAGGEPRRLTYHPGADRAVAWTPDGKSVLFTSNRNSYAGFDRLFTVSLSGGLPAEVPLPMGEDGSYSADATRLAYVPLTNWSARTAWKRYRGGRYARVWLAQLSDSSIEKVPGDGSNDLNPMWVGDTVYFLSDRGGPVALYAYDTRNKQVKRVVDPGERDIKSAAAGPGAIVYEQLGSIHLYDLKSGKNETVPIEVSGDMPAMRPHFERVAAQIQNFGISPTGLRAVFEAHGDIFTAPLLHGDIRDITHTPGAEERSPAWSPDGQTIAYFSDASGDYQLYIEAQDGMGKDGSGEIKKIGLGDPPSFFYSPRWSPDGKKIAYTDKRLNVWYVDVSQASPTPVKVDTDAYDSGIALEPEWSPDSAWIVYNKQTMSHVHQVMVYSIADAKAQAVTDGMSDARSAHFDRGGNYIYFTASTDVGPGALGLDMTSQGHPVTRSVYCAVLRTDLASPLAPESDEEKVPAAAAANGGRGGRGRGGAAPDAADAADSGGGAPESAAQQAGNETRPAPAAAPAPVRIDFENISQRILALPMPAANYTDLQTGRAGILFVEEAAAASGGRGGRGEPGGGPGVWRFDMKTRQRTRFMDGVSAFQVSANGDRMLVRNAGGGGRGAAAVAEGAPAGGGWAIVATAQAPRANEGSLRVDTMEAMVDPPAEFRQMYHEVWRIERDFLYDPGAHGLNIPAAEAYYSQYLPGIGGREDLNYLFNDMLGEITIGHMFIAGGEMPAVERVGGGLLGADYTVEQGRYRFAKIYQGENWNPQLRAPLTEPGVNVKAGEYLLSVDGRELRGTDNIFSFFENTASKQVVLKVGPNPDGTGSRNVTVIPVASETTLRNRSWMDDNRREVDTLSNGKLAYVYLPDTAAGGYTNFNRYYYAQLDKQGAVIDERFNSGGEIADYIIDNLHRPLIAKFTTREGADWGEPTGSIYGPKAMIINAFAGSGGDAMPWMFRQAAVGTLVGERTWGGLVGIGGYPPLMDGGTVNAPREAFYNLNGQWDVENHGVAPDVEVELSPQLWRQGHDPQLEKAVAVVMQQLAAHPAVIAKKPAYPNYHQNFPAPAPAPANAAGGASGGGH